MIKGGEESVPGARAIVKTLTDKYPLIQEGCAAGKRKDGNARPKQDADAGKAQMPDSTERKGER